MYVPDTRLQKLEDAAQEMLERATDASVRELASAVGKVVSMVPAIPAVRMMTKECYKLVRPEDGDWDTEVKITHEGGDELMEIVKMIRVWNKRGAPLWMKLGATELRIINDAGPDGYGYRLDGNAR